MKLIHTFVMLGLTVMSLTNCKHSEVKPPIDPQTTCKLVKSEWGDNNSHTFIYDAKGQITQMTAVYGGKPYVYLFTHDANQQITGASITFEGRKPTELSPIGTGDAVKITWKNGRIAQLVDMLGGKAMLTTTITYDAEGRIISFKGDADRKWGQSFEKVYTYQSNGDFGYKYLENGVVTYYEDTSVNKQVRHPESLLAEHGLPFDVTFATPWMQYGLSDLKGYDIDQAGNKKLVRSIHTNKFETNQRQMVTSVNVVLGGKDQVMKYDLADCN